MRERYHIGALTAAGRTIRPTEVAARADAEDLTQTLAGEILLRHNGEVEFRR